MQAIQMKGLVKRYKDLTAVNKLDLDIQQGELFSLLGVNGAGKTTAIKMLSCLTEPTEGDAMVGGYSVREEADRVKGLIGVSPQETAVAPNLSVKENLELICGALLTNLSAWLSGVWFDLELVGGVFEKIAYALPFVHAAELEKALFQGDFALVMPHLLPVLLYGTGITAAAVVCFLRQMKKQ